MNVASDSAKSKRFVCIFLAICVSKFFGKWSILIFHCFHVLLLSWSVVTQGGSYLSTFLLLVKL